MLVLTRKSNQSIMIGDDIEISVLSVMGDKVRIGIQAPRSVPVYRREVYVAIQRERDDDLIGTELPKSPPSWARSAAERPGARPTRGSGTARGTSRTRRSPPSRAASARAR